MQKMTLRHSRSLIVTTSVLNNYQDGERKKQSTQHVFATCEQMIYFRT
uniref:Uncharacterized protein n=1 Tax=Arundo donax TaxID=35708 RepID=A0A0A9ELI8_ARUDO